MLVLSALLENADSAPEPWWRNGFMSIADSLMKESSDYVPVWYDNPMMDYLYGGITRVLTNERVAELRKDPYHELPDATI